MFPREQMLTAGRENGKGIRIGGSLTESHQMVPVWQPFIRAAEVGGGVRLERQAGQNR